MIPQSSTATGQPQRAPTNDSRPPYPSTSIPQTRPTPNRAITSIHPPKRQRTDGPDMPPLKHRVYMIDNRVELLSRELVQQNAIEWPRYQLLKIACEQEDLFYVSLHQIFCIWDQPNHDQIMALPNFPSSNDLVVAFRVLGQLLRNNTSMRDAHKKWFSEFPGPLDYLLKTSAPYREHVKDVGIFLGQLATEWTCMVKLYSKRRYPLLVDEMSSTLNLLSPVLQHVVFTAGWRNLEIEEDFGLQMEEFFQEDRRGHEGLADRMGTDRPPSQKEIYERNSQVRTNYRDICQKSDQARRTAASANTVSTGSLHANVNQPLRTVAGHLQRQDTASPNFMRQSSISPIMGQVPQHATTSSARSSPIRAIPSTMALPVHPSSIAGQPTYSGTSSPIMLQQLSMQSPVQQGLSMQSPPIPQGFTPTVGSNSMPTVYQQQMSRQFPPNNGMTSSNPFPNINAMAHDLGHPPQHLQQMASQGQQPVEQDQRAPHHMSHPSMERVQHNVLEQQRTQHQRQQMQLMAQQQHQIQIQQMRLQRQPQIWQQHLQQNQPRQMQQSPDQLVGSLVTDHRRANSRYNCISTNGQQSLIVNGQANRASRVAHNAIQNNKFSVFKGPIFIPTTNHWRAQPQPCNPDRHALHQAHLRSPRLKVSSLSRIEKPQDDPKSRYYQVVNGFSCGPVLLPHKLPLATFDFTISKEDHDRIAKDRPAEPGKVAVRELGCGILQYRLRSIATKPGVSTCRPSDWVLAETCWPENSFMELDKTPLEMRRKFHHAKDLPIDITHILASKSATTHQLTVASPKCRSDHPDFFYAVEVIEILQHQQVMDMCQQQRIPADQTIDMVKKRLAPVGDDDDFAIVVSDLVLDLADPFTSRIFEIPVRGKSCVHDQCFDLETFLLTRQSKPSKAQQPCLPDVWKCPLCGKDARPSELEVNDFLVSVRAELKERGNLDVKAILIAPDGTWKVKEAPKSRKGTKGPSDPEEDDNTALPIRNALTPTGKKVIEVIDLDD
ncbi:hypothetical protein BJ875DRAFT_379042 [Amylocarpus encephaloides]|uniref:SP-RING-type domain-containing protein n=1 Tax=Amylocarpus encephaloides TaxID=45428 RepID=A0A9P7YGG9_9HELO|nr:hypothetical protein BJ875DRAFT_379042 [Amylocarpus encephaloides]